jgi:hypothetical protein
MTDATYKPGQYAHDPREKAVEDERGGSFVNPQDQAAVERELKQDNPEEKKTDGK